jgi:hypothetical protein
MLFLYRIQKSTHFLLALRLRRSGAVPLTVCLYGVERHNITCLEQKVTAVGCPVVGLSEHNKCYFSSIKCGQSHE